MARGQESKHAVEPAARRERRERAGKISDAVALEIVQDIVSQGLAPGAALPVESRMLDAYDAGRSSVREALRLLEAQGLIEIKRGAGLGATVGKSDPKRLGRTILLHLHILDVDYDELLDGWLATEPMLARLAAGNPDRQAVRIAMEPFLDPSTPRLMSEGADFHEVVSRLAGNRVLWLMLRSVASMVADQVMPFYEESPLDPRIAADHVLIAEAIVAGDQVLAGAAMRRHVEHVIEDFKGFWPDKIGERVNSGSRPMADQTPDGAI